MSANVHTCPLYYTRTQSHRLLSGRDKNPNKTKIQIKLQRCRFSEIHDLKTFSFLLQCVIVVFLCLSCLALCQGPWLVDWLIDWHRYQCCWSDRLPSSRSGLYVRVDLIRADDEQRGRSFPLWNRGQNVYQPPHGPLLHGHFIRYTSSNVKAKIRRTNWLWLWHGSWCEAAWCENLITEILTVEYRENGPKRQITQSVVAVFATCVDVWAVKENIKGNYSWNSHLLEPG